jgi:hypothetical protein
MKKIAAAILLLGTSWTAAATTLVHNITGYTMNDGALVRFAGMEHDQGRVTQLYRTEGEALDSMATEKIDGTPRAARSFEIATGTQPAY